MNILVTILVVVVGIVILLLIAGLFLKKEFYIERSIVIHKSKQEVFNYLKILKNAEQFNKWVMTDPTMKKTLTGVDGTKGFVYAWDSANKNAGAGAQEIIDIKEGLRIDYELRFERPFKNTSYSSLILTATAPEQTTVTWNFSGNLKYPINLMHQLLNLSKMLGKDMDTSLNHLKTILEKK